MNKIDLQLENLATEIELHGRSGHDSIYKNNVCITFKAEDWELPSNVCEREVQTDLDWFLKCADSREAVEHPKQLDSFWLMQFGQDAEPYGPDWDLPYVLESLVVSEQSRRAVLTNKVESCVMNYQFHQADWNRVDVSVFMRSSDVAGVLAYDLALSRALLERVCELTSYEVGNVTFLIGNAHIRYQDMIHGEEFTIDFGL